MRYDADAALYSTQSRWYSPTLMRFISIDPIGFEAGDVNLYRFVGDRPVDATDPSGLQEKEYTLKMIPDKGPLYGFNGAFWWSIRWNVEPYNCKGVILQHIKWDFNVKKYDLGEPTLNVDVKPEAPREYVEAWFVEGGGVVTPLSTYEGDVTAQAKKNLDNSGIKPTDLAKAKFHDVYAFAMSAGGTTKTAGKISITGTATFYEGVTKGLVQE